MYEALIFEFPSLNTNNNFDRELFQDKKGHWIYLDKDKTQTNNIKDAKYQKWVKQ